MIALSRKDIQQIALETLYHIFLAQSKDCFYKFHNQNRQCTHYCVRCVLRLLKCWEQYFNSKKQYSGDHYNVVYHLKKRIESLNKKELSNPIIESQPILQDGVKHILTEMTIILLQEQRSHCQSETMLLVLGLIYSQLNNYKSSNDYFIKLKTRYPFDRLYPYLYAKNLANLQQNEKALKQLDDVLQENSLQEEGVYFSYDNSQQPMQARLKSDYYNLKGNISLKMNLAFEASYCYQLALEADIYNKDTYYSILNMLIFHGNQLHYKQIYDLISKFIENFNDYNNLAMLTAIQFQRVDLMIYELERISCLLKCQPNQEYRIWNYQKFASLVNLWFLNYQGNSSSTQKLPNISKSYNNYFNAIKEYRNGHFEKALSYFSMQKRQVNKYKIMSYLGLNQKKQANELFRIIQQANLNKIFISQVYTVLNRPHLAIKKIRQEKQFFKNRGCIYLFALILLIINYQRVGYFYLQKDAYNLAYQCMKKGFLFNYYDMYSLVRMNYFLAQYSFQKKIFAKGKYFVKTFRYFLNVISLLNPVAAKTLRYEIDDRVKHDIKMLDVQYDRELVVNIPLMKK